jgi:hypothetical protein
MNSNTPPTGPGPWAFFRGGWKDHAKATKEAAERTTALLDAFTKEKTAYIAQKLGFSSKFIPSKYEVAGLEADLAICDRNEEACRQTEEGIPLQENLAEGVRATGKRVQAHLERMRAELTAEEYKQKLEAVRNKVKLKDGTRGLLRFLDDEDGGPNPLQVEELQAEVGRLTQEVEKMAKAKEASDIEREAWNAEFEAYEAKIQKMVAAKEAWDAEREAYRAGTLTMAREKEVWDAERKAHRIEVRRLNEEIQTMAKVKEASDAELEACQRVHEVGKVTLVQTLKDLAGVQAKSQEAMDSLQLREEELRQAREKKAKRGRELEGEPGDELESKKRQKHDAGLVHPLIDVADGILWVLRELPLSMWDEQCYLIEAEDLFSLLMPVARDTAMWARLYEFVQDDWDDKPDINVAYCVRAVTRVGLGPDALACICKDGERCVVITKNEDGTVYFGYK